jgi:hypothetical protein
MARSLEASSTPIVASAPAQLASITGVAVFGAVAKVRGGKAIADGPRAAKIGVFGPPGTGKTFMIIKLLLAGRKVLLFTSDFGGTGDDATIVNYFDQHPEQAQFLSNLRVVTFNVKALIQFINNPDSIEGLEDIYEWDPDWLVWDGVTAFQMGDLEHELTGGDYLRKDTDYSVWKQARNGTVFPLMKFLRLSNIKTGKPWSKLATFLEAEKSKKRKTQDRQGKTVLEDIEGTEKTGPMLDTTARELAGAGFDLMLQTRVESIGATDKFFYVSRGADLMVKDRNFNVPAKVGVNDFWDGIIAKKLKWEG